MWYRADPNVVNEDDWKIYLPQSMIQDVIRWYHLIVGHPGVTQVYDMIQARFHLGRLSIHYRDYIFPDNCSRFKQQGRG